MVDIETNKIIDRFHLIQNLMGYVKQVFQRLLPNLIKVSHLSENQVYQFLTLQEKILLAQKLKKENVPISIIAKQVGMNIYTLQKYIALSKRGLREKIIRKQLLERCKSFIPKE
ncbi:Transposase [Bacillus thuringiensis serovar tochigiensis BGSC 4Y1]|nr:Transposase [Bacillus thuringiensis serovar tochigiensis BGSC 4Y1]